MFTEHSLDEIMLPPPYFPTLKVRFVLSVEFKTRLIDLNNKDLNLATLIHF